MIRIKEEELVKLLCAAREFGKEVALEEVKKSILAKGWDSFLPEIKRIRELNCPDSRFDTKTGKFYKVEVSKPLIINHARGSNG